MTNKYNARKTEVDGITFDSRREALRYQELRLMVRAGLICELETQKKFDIVINDQKVCSYYADFMYYDKEKECWVVEDVKGGKATQTPVYRLKKKLMKAVLGVDIQEIT